MAQPAAELDKTSSRMVVRVRSLGAVPFDSMTLPLVGLRIVDGQREFLVAAQHGATPGWPAMLADGSADSRRVPGGLRITAFHESAVGGDRGAGLKAVAWERGLPRGVLLGRSCNEQGFLVEWPRADGSRWIGRVDWDSGVPKWVVDDGGVGAFATLGPRGELAYSRLVAPADGGVGGEFELVVRSTPDDAASERVLAIPGVSLVFPMFSADRERVYVMAVGREAGSRLRVLAVKHGSEKVASPALGVCGTAELNVEASIASACQAAMCVQTPWCGPESGPLSHGVAIMATDAGSMGWFDGNAGSITTLARGTVGAAPAIDADGVRASGMFLGAAAELVYLPLAQESGAVAVFGRETNVLRGGYLPRCVGKGKACAFVLISPPIAGTGEVVGVYEIRTEKDQAHVR